MSLEPYFDDGTVTLYLGDCREVLPELNIAADAIVTDPPYGETSLEWDRWPVGWLASARSVSSSMWCFGGLRMFMAHAGEFATSGWRLSHDVVGEDEDVDVVWKKHNPSGPNADRFRRIHEQAAFFYGGRWSTIYREPQRVFSGVREPDRVVKQGAKESAQRGSYRTGSWRDDGTRLLTSVIPARSMHRRGAIHPTEKPVELLDPLIRYSCPPSGLILDLFAGSGSTLDAARRAGRRAIGIEGFEPYAEAAAKRLSRPVHSLEQATS